MTGLGGTGVEVMLSVMEGKYILQPYPVHPMVSVIRVANPTASSIPIPPAALDDFDLTLSDDIQNWNLELEGVLLKVSSGQIATKHSENNDFQISRGPTGISV